MTSQLTQVTDELKQVRFQLECLQRREAELLIERERLWAMPAAQAAMTSRGRK